MERLDKILSHMGYGSRKEVKELIRKGYVVVNGEVIKNDDFKVDIQSDEIILDGLEIKYESLVYLMLNKPDGVISATYDPRYETVCDLCSEYEKMNIFPVGRLDIDTEGLLLLTNDGDLAHKLLSPKNHVDKKYYVEFEGTYQDSFDLEFESGIIIDDGYKCMPARIEYLGDNKANIIIQEGKFHQVKRMFEALGLYVTYLRRISFGSLKIDENLSLGEYRHLTENELNSLKELTK
ncbi:MAG: pseudouridine synthase [Anaeroplasmataceae bacterium]